MIHRLQRLSSLSALIALGVVVPTLVVARDPSGETNTFANGVDATTDG